MAWSPFNIIGGAYADDALPWSAQDTLNWMPVRAERPGTRSQWKLETPPGLVEFCDLGTGQPLRGVHDAEGLLLAVSGTKLFRISTAGVPTLIGTIPGVGRVSMAHNQITNGNQVAIANGNAGYVYNTLTNALVQITDEGFPGARVFDFIDGYMAFVEPQGRFWGHSDLADALSYNTFDRSEAESAPDRIVTLIVSHREVMTPGQRTGEFFRNTGQAKGTFQRVDGTEMEIGIASVFSIARLDNTVYFLGHDGIVYRLVGHSPQRVSTGPIEQDISRCNIANAFAMTWEDRGHKVFMLTLPDGHTWCYDVWTDEWHRKASYGLDRWRIATLTRWNKQWIAGDYANGKLYRLDWDAYTEAGQPIISRRRGGLIHSAGDDVVIAGLRLGFDVGRVPVGVDDHFCSIRYSDDGGHNWSDARLASIGAAGEYSRRVEEWQLGMARQRIWEIEVSSPARRDLIDAQILVEETF